MTYKQNLFAEYLLKRIGFKNPDSIANYLIKLESVHGRYIQEYRQFRYKNGSTGYEDYWSYSASQCIEILLEEVKLKEQPHSIKGKESNRTSIVSATDLANFNFCPASYAIGVSSPENRTV